ncbi:hypothetical protein L2E82_39176 [Cichorium intybus]|uniref:Uncharacterized protein n=1 Tax=Cichorium intybus TaxID=13427 RepID=A0ACB9AHA0_CICIN|nr:hypothetical protein L2E82_39176 [Cichorium intybus]
MLSADVVMDTGNTMVDYIAMADEVDHGCRSRLHFEPSSQMPSWKLMASVSEMNCPPAQSPVDRFNNFESALSPMVSSPVSNSSAPNDTFAVRELIGKLGRICNGGGELFPAAMALVAAGATRLRVI